MGTENTSATYRRTQNPRVTKSFFCFAGIQKISSKISDKIQLLYNECRGCTVVELLVTWIFCIWEEKKKIVSRVLDFFGSNITFLFLCGECATNTKISDRRLLSIDIFVFVKRERHTKRIEIKT